MDDNVNQLISGFTDALIGVVGGLLFFILFLFLHAMHAEPIFYLVVILYFIADLLAGLFKAIITGIIYSIGLFIGGLLVSDLVTAVLGIIGIIVNIMLYYNSG